MDPNATFAIILDLLEEDPHNTAALDAACADLAEWLGRGGFAPTGFTSRWESDEAATAYFEDWQQRQGEDDD